MPQQTAGFDLDAIISRIEEVDRDNSVAEIDLPEKEWRRLAAEGMASLKARLSKRAADRLMLMDGLVEGDVTRQRYYLLVCHYGRCH